MKQLQFILLLAMSALLTACASVPMASFDKDAQAKSFAAQKSKAQLYIYRNETWGTAIKMQLELDGVAIGETAAHTYAAIVLKPGRHILVSKASDASRLELNLKAGQNYYVWQEVKMGWVSGNSKLQLVDEVTGKAGVEQSKLIRLDGLPAGMAMPSGNDQNIEDLAEIEKVPFRAGVSSATVERLAKQHSCAGDQGAGLLTPPGPVEVYRVSCDQGSAFMARCELRQCKAMR
ncbi:DUF2846 domain-containing protein [Undibacterium sp.]|jgi:hypothetical protein|uniref:DUF2846 domain-containing protein n=1 Tax=Undibacterium sp. TaxID=1914977 RepID=UPI002CA10CBD|nr:DUF2846 domain-containing protein [Undibacterium sp.]HTD05330.1 DUF2846 domain-containing protein [Undibacterium sp.]